MEARVEVNYSRGRALIGTKTMHDGQLAISNLMVQHFFLEV
jgi:hypothetical protein